MFHFSRAAWVGSAALAILCLTTPGHLLAADAMEKPALTETQRILQTLNRLGFGARPGDVERVQKTGLQAYIDQQLHPEQISDSECESALAKLDTLQMSSAHLTDEFYDDIRRFLQVQMKAGDAAEMKLRYGVEPAQIQKPMGMAPANPFSPEELVKRDGVRAIGELQQAKLIRAVLSERQLNEVLVDFWSNHFNIDVRKNSCRALKTEDDRDVIRPHVWGRFRDLLGATAHSPAMLVYLDNNENAVARDRSKLEKTVIDLFIGYKLGMRSSGIVADREGPNENYGREILELHTLGVDGGYTQQDVQEVARCFSGWSMNGFGGKFEFQANRHDNGQKTVLGHVIPAGGGVIDGEAVLDILASHPSTAHFISRELCERFVSDEPPAELIDRVAGVFLDTDGDLRAVVRAIITSPEFFSPQYYRSKIKSPFEYAVSAVRASGGNFIDEINEFQRRMKTMSEGGATLGYNGNKLSSEKRKSLNWHVYDMGEPLFAFSAPTGYPEDSRKWVNSGALIDRLNFALALMQQEVTDVHVELPKLLADVDADQPRAVLDRMSEVLLHGELSPATRKTLEKNVLPREGESKTVDVGRIGALILGSPEFQRR